jgi:hypothetical protein
MVRRIVYHSQDVVQIQPQIVTALDRLFDTRISVRTPFYVGTDETTLAPPRDVPGKELIFLLRLHPASAAERKLLSERRLYDLVEEELSGAYERFTAKTQRPHIYVVQRCIGDAEKHIGVGIAEREVVEEYLRKHSRSSRTTTRTV